MANTFRLAQGYQIGKSLAEPDKTDLALQIRAEAEGRVVEPLTWSAIRPLVQDFWWQQRTKLPARFAPGRLKQWLVWLARSYPEAAALFVAVRAETDCARLDALVADAGRAQ